MKKSICLLLALTMALALCGCAESLQQIEIPPLPQVTPTPAPASAAPATETPAPVVEIPERPQPTGEGTEPSAAPIEINTPKEESSRILVNIGRTQIQDFDPAEGEELILDFSYDMPRVLFEQKPEVAEKINEVLATVEETFYTGQDYGLRLQFIGYNGMLEAAEDNFSWVREYQVEGQSLELSDCLSAKVTRLDDNMLSILYSDVNYTGGAHGSYGSFGYTFDMSTGELLSLEKLSSDPAGLSEYLVQTMLEMAEADPESFPVEDSFLPAGGREEAFRNLLREGAWYFDREGLVIFSTLYELAPYAAGITEFPIPYEKLAGKIDGRYLFPVERSGNGRVLVDELSALDGGSLEIVDKITAHEDGAQLCLTAEGLIYDVSISRVYYVDRFYENEQLWCASSLQDCAVQLQAVVPDGLPNLLITYYTGDGVRHGKLLSQSGQDGSFMLVDDDIQAVG